MSEQTGEQVEPLTEDEVDNQNPELMGYRWCKRHRQAEKMDAFPVRAYEESVDSVVARMYDSALKLCEPQVGIRGVDDEDPFIAILGWRFFTVREVGNHRNLRVSQAEAREKQERAEYERLREKFE